MKKLLILVIGLIWAAGSQAQFIPGVGEDRIIVTPNIAPAKTIIKTSVLSPFAERNSIRLAVEYTIGKQFSIQPEWGYIFGYSTAMNKLQPNTMSYEQRLGFRYYVPEKFFNGLYIGPLFTYSILSYQKGTWRNVDPAVPDSILIDFSNPYQYREQDFGVYAVVGIQPVVLKKFVIDLNGGYGLEYHYLVTKFDPLLKNGQNPTPPIKQLIPGPILSLHIGYFFK